MLAPILSGNPKTKDFPSSDGFLAGISLSSSDFGKPGFRNPKTKAEVI